MVHYQTSDFVKWLCAWASCLTLVFSAKKVDRIVKMVWQTDENICAKLPQQADQSRVQISPQDTKTSPNLPCFEANFLKNTQCSDNLPGTLKVQWVVSVCVL